MRAVVANFSTSYIYRAEEPIMDLGLRGSRALIAGGSRGIGFAIAEALAAEGAAVGLVARDAAGLAAAAERLAPRGTPIATAVADVTDTPALNRAVDDIATALGGLDHLVANAGGTIGRGNLTSAEPGEFTATLALNAGHAAELIRAGLSHLRAAGGDAVVIISSITGIRPAPRRSWPRTESGSTRSAPARSCSWVAAGRPSSGTTRRRPTSWPPCCHRGRRGSPGPTSWSTVASGIRARAPLADRQTAPLLLDFVLPHSGVMSVDESGDPGQGVVGGHRVQAAAVAQPQRHLGGCGLAGADHGLVGDQPRGADPGPEAA
jgi:NAD(P)-dependent dehydrogenase (short-subunit alcohol dehydrogenase family)